MFHLETGPNTPRYEPVEYDAITGPTSPIPKPMELSGSNGQDDPEDHEAKKMWIRRVITSEIHRHRSLGIPNNMTPEEYKARDYCADPLEGYWQPEDDCHDMDWSCEYDWITDNAPDALFMGNDSCLEDNHLEEYYTYDTDSTQHFSYMPYYIYDTDS